MSDQEPVMKIHLDGEDRLATRQNTTLFTYLGENALYSHIFVTLEEETEPPRRIGAFIFRALHPEVYGQMLEFMADNQYPGVVNQLEVSPGDVAAFNNACYSDIESSDSFPDEWTNEQGETA